MRTFFLLLLLSQHAFALDTGDGSFGVCDDITLTSPTVNNDNIYNCTDINIGAIDASTFSHTNAPVILKATGTVNIGNIDFQGQPGAILGGAGGPGAGAGGDFLGSASNGFPIGQGGQPPLAAAGCGTGDSEGSGGAGGNLVIQGDPGFDGILLTGTGGSLASGGLPGPTTISININNLTVAGAGGASGEAGCVAPTTPQSAGAGGGGGGAIQIIAGADVNITGTITVRGGDGEDIGTIGGGGGGGSGGIIIIQSEAQIILAGSLNADFGEGGTNLTLPVDEGDGGNGAPGMIILQDLDGVVPGVISPTPTVTPVNGSPSISRSSLSSDISCGTIASKNENKNLFFQMVIGFGFVLMISEVFRVQNTLRSLL